MSEAIITPGSVLPPPSYTGDHDNAMKELGAPQLEVLDLQLTEHARLNGTVLHSDLRDRFNAGDTTMPAGTLIHGTRYSPEGAASVAANGVMSGELFGIAEDAETHYCADFFRTEKDTTIADYSQWVVETEPTEGRLRVRRMEGNYLPNARAHGERIGIIVDPSIPEVQSLLEADAYRPGTDELFAGDWFAETEEMLTKITNPDQRKLPEDAGSVFAQMIPSGPGHDVRNNLQLFVQLIHTAKKQVVITNPYFIPDESLTAACGSAARRGVEIIIINSEAMDQFAVGHAQHSYYEELLEAGVKIHLYKSPVFLHSKHMTIDDDIAVIGSSNMDIRSFALDLECVVVLYDKKVVSDLKKVQKGDLAHTKKLVLSKWKKRKLRYRFLESVTRLTSSLQ